MTTIHILSGLPGSGKTEFILSHMKPADISVHRDIVRDNYRHLSKKDFYDIWRQEVADHLEVAAFLETDLWIDQATIGEGSAAKLITSLPTQYPIVIHQIRRPAQDCIADCPHVAPDVISKMASHFYIAPLGFANKMAALGYNVTVDVISICI